MRDGWTVVVMVEMVAVVTQVVVNCARRLGAEEKRLPAMTWTLGRCGGNDMHRLRVHCLSQVPEAERALRGHRNPIPFPVIGGPSPLATP